MLLNESARSVLAQADEIDRALLSGLQDTRSISVEMRTLRAQIAKLPKGKHPPTCSALGRTPG
jgi:hypothetical protein